MGTPRVSLGMPVYNGAEHIAETLDSILAQTYRDFEVIVCDNASTDDTCSIVESYAARDSRIRLERNAANVGAAENYNRSFRSAVGDLFRWVAHDDLLLPSFLERCVETLDANPDVVLAFCERYVMNHDGKHMRTESPYHWYEAKQSFDRISFLRLMCVNGVRYPMMIFGLVRSSALRQTRLIGAYIHADLVTVAELRLRGHFSQIPERLFITRRHNESDLVFRGERRTIRGELTWYGVSSPRRFAISTFPEVKLMIERLTAVRNSRLPLLEKLWYGACAVLGHLWVRSIDLLYRQWYRIKKWIYCRWHRYSVHMMRKEQGLFVRLWYLLYSVRSNQWRALRCVINGPHSERGQMLMTFAATRFSKRTDIDATRLLCEWHHHGSPNQKRAVQTIKADDPQRFHDIVAHMASKRHPPTVTALEQNESSAENAILE